MVFDVVAESSGLLVARLGLGDVDLLGAGRLGQGLQLRLGRKAPAELPVGVQGAEQRRQPYQLQQQQGAVLADLFQRDNGESTILTCACSLPMPWITPSPPAILAAGRRSSTSAGSNKAIFIC